MTVKVGDKVPAATMKVMGAQGPAHLHRPVAPLICRVLSLMLTKLRLKA